MRPLVSGDAIVRALRHSVERYRTLRILETLSCVDELTGLYNRRGVITAGAQVLQLARRRSTGLWVLYADVDGLKSINDRHGHQAGDRALVDVAVALRASFRGSDVIGRMGGDEFAVLAIDAALESRELLLHRIRRNVERRNAETREPFPVALSAGCARFEPSSAADLPELLGRADKELYEGRRGRREATADARPSRRP